MIHTKYKVKVTKRTRVSTADASKICSMVVAVPIARQCGIAIVATSKLVAVVVLVRRFAARTNTTAFTIAHY